MNDYSIIRKILEANLIKVKYDWELYYFFIKNETLYNFKYSKESNLNPFELKNIVSLISLEYKINYYILFYLSHKNNNSSVLNIIYSYQKTKLPKEIFKYTNKFDLGTIKFNFENINNTTISKFYENYLNFSIKKGFKIKNLGYYQDLILKNINNFSLINLYTDKNENIWWIILLKIFDKIIVMYWYYDIKYIKKWLKYLVNKYIIDFYQNDDTVNEIVFWTWKIENDYDDSIIKFKSKFWDFYILNKLEWYLE